MVAVGVRDAGEKSALGVAVGASETEAFSLELLRTLLARGLHGVQLVIADAHQGLRAALTQCFTGAAYQRCKVHFLRNVAAAVPKQHASAALAAAKAIFLQATPEAAHEVLHQAAELIERRFPKVMPRGVVRVTLVQLALRTDDGR